MNPPEVALLLLPANSRHLTEASVRSHLFKIPPTVSCRELFCQKPVQPEKVTKTKKDPTGSSKMAEENIFLFVPNLIGYARVILALIAFYLMPCCPWPAVFCYLLSALLDAFDGHAARALNQSTKFGAMMDMLTDRCATMCLLVNLSLLYPSYTFLFQLSMSLDIASHWLHLHSSTIKGSASHKTIDLSGNPVLRIYYTSKPVLFVMCAGNELFFCLLYVLHHIQEPAVWLYWLQGLCGIICLIKSGISVLHLVTASQNMAAFDAAEREKSRK